MAKNEQPRSNKSPLWIAGLVVVCTMGLLLAWPGCGGDGGGDDDWAEQE